jgi:hypothetical protein
LNAVNAGMLNMKKFYYYFYFVNNIHGKDFSILIGWEQCNFEEIQCRKKKYSAEKNYNAIFLCYFRKHSDWKDILFMIIFFMYRILILYV